ncbi:MAG: hypothetical protein PWQ35_206 [Patescibacteria group bacterium]|nr:hypothetical protein [Patescibacteria group bacterium]
MTNKFKYKSMKYISFLIIIIPFILGGCSSFIYTPNDSQTNNEAPNSEIQNNESKTLDISLNLSGQNLDKIPNDVFSRASLEELDVSNNNLTGAIQAEIRQLSKLTILNASNNQMTGVPAEIGQLQNLEILDLSNNNLTGLPYELGNLKNLKTLNISGNNYSEQDLQIIIDNLPDNVNIIK